MTSPVVLDASALLAWLYDEPGAGAVDPVLPGAHLSTANLAEVCQKIDAHGGDADRVAERLRLLGVLIEDLTSDDAVRSARLRSAGRRVGLSLGDRSCLALAARLGATALTADRVWAEVDLPVAVGLVR